MKSYNYVLRPLFATSLVSLRKKRPLTHHNVISNNLNVPISIRASVLVPEANNVAELMDDNTKLITVLANRYRLGATAAFANK